MSSSLSPLLFPFVDIYLNSTVFLLMSSWSSVFTPLLILIFPFLLLFFSVVYFKVSSWFCLLFLFTILTFSPNTTQLDWCVDVWIILAASYFFCLFECQYAFQPSEIKSNLALQPLLQRQRSNASPSTFMIICGLEFLKSAWMCI